MKTFFAAALAGAVTANNNNFAFMQYVAEHGKSYSDIQEWNMRFELW